MNTEKIMDKVSFIRNVGTSIKNEKTWLFFEPPILEAAGLKPGDRIEMTIIKEKKALVFIRSENGDHVISRRKRAGRADRPLMDRCNEEITGIIRTRKRVDILVSDGIFIVREEQTFDFCVFDRPALQGRELKKFRLLSLPSGCGIASKALESTGFFECVFGGDIMQEAIETYKYNFPTGAAFWGDLRRLNPEYLDPVDAVWLSPSCTKFSLLAGQGSAGGFTEGMGPFYANLVLASQAKIVMIEEVPQYFSSRSFEMLKALLSFTFPYWSVEQIDAYDFGSPAGRKRGYAIASQKPLNNFKWSKPKIPDHRRPTIEQVIGKDWEGRAPFREIKGTVMEGLLNKSGNNNFKAEKNRTLVKPSDVRMSALVASISKIQVTSSYLQHPDHANLWRPFTSSEMASILDVSSDFVFPDYIPETKRTYMLGNSVDSRVVKSLGIEGAFQLMMDRLEGKDHQSTTTLPLVPHEYAHLNISEDINGQFAFDI